MFFGFTAFRSKPFDCMGAPMEHSVSSLLATETYSIVMACVCKYYVVEFKQHHVFSSQCSPNALDRHVMNCDRLSNGKNASHFSLHCFFPLTGAAPILEFDFFFSFHVRCCLPCSGVFTSTVRVYSYHWVTGALENVFLRNRTNFFVFID